MAKKKPSLARKWSFRVIALVVWAYIVYVNSSLFETWPPPPPFSEVYTQDARPFRILVYVLLTLLFIRWCGKPRAIYVASFPLWAPVLVVWEVLKLFGINIKRLNSLASPKAGMVCIIFMVVCYFAIHDLSSPYFVYSAVGLLVFLSVLIVYGVFLWAMRPLAGLSAFVEKFNEYQEKQSKKTIEEVEGAAKGENEDAIHKKIKNEESFLSAIAWFERVVLTPQRVVGLFCIVLVFSVVLIELNYSVAYWGLNKVDAQHFESRPGERDFWDFAYFGLMVMTTSGLSSIVPVSSLAKVLASSQLLCSVVLLSMLILAFSTVGHGDVSSVSRSLGRLREEKRDLCARMRSVGGIEDAEVEELDSEQTEEG